MGEPINAERLRQHYATVVSPSLLLTPYGQRTVVGVPSVNFAHSFGVALRTFGNSANLFTMNSVALDLITGTIFKPKEGLPRNPAEGSPAVAHGHTGDLIFVGGAVKPAAVVAGTTPDADTECTAELTALIEAIASKSADELKGDFFGFYSRFQAGQEKGYGDALAAAASQAMSAGQKLLEFMDKYGSPDRIARQLAQAGVRYVSSGQAQAHAEAVQRFFNDVNWRDAPARMKRFAEALDPDRLKALVANWLLSEIRRLGCEGREMLRAMLQEPRPMSTQLGELYGAAKATTHLIAAGVAVEVLVTRGALTAAARGGVAAAKAGTRMGGLFDEIGEVIDDAWARSRRPDPNPPEASRPATPAPRPDTPADPPAAKPREVNDPENASVQGQRNGEADLPCLSACRR
jgi:hypothetical protein